MSTAEAEALTAAIRETADNLIDFLAEAKERRAWRALGYGSWAAYVETEFSMSRSRAYQLLHHAKVIEALEVSTSVDTSALTEGQTRGADPEEVRRQVADGASPEEAVKQARQRRGSPVPRSEPPDEDELQRRRAIYAFPDAVDAIRTAQRNIGSCRNSRQL
ncbi:MAG TPA: hypothetical protein VGF64_01940, partial [Acidimicrobiales bacterium]